MGTGTVTSALSGTVIPAEHHNSLRSAIIGDFVPRAAAGTVSDTAGSLGSSGLKWLSVFSESLTIGTTSSIEISEDGSNNLVFSIGGNQRALIPSAAPLIPPGTVWQYCGNTAPDQWLLCDGSAVSRVTYADLFAVIGESFGEGDGASTFNVPDMRGRFVRGWDNGAGNDPDAASRVELATGGATGDAIGSYQDYDFPEHSHDLRASNEIGGQSDGWPTGATNARGPQGDGTALIDVAQRESVYSLREGFATDSVNCIKVIGGNESRPRNVYMNFIIKI